MNRAKRRAASLPVWMVLACAVMGPAVRVGAADTAFTYQGQLKEDGAPADGLHDFRFRLFDAASGGAQVGPMLCADSVDVINGLFTLPLDFGQQYATTAQPHLEVQVRREIGQPCTDNFGYVLLSPRQQITATPLASHAKSAFALDAADGSPVNAVFVDNDGKVGIGTSNPGGKVDIQASDNSNVLFGRRTGGALTHNLFIDGNGNGSMQLRDSAGVTRVNLVQGDFTYLNYGNVGIGTEAPLAKLDVRGDIRLGSAGQFRATGGEENLRIVRGTIGRLGNIIAGSGFQVSRPDPFDVYIVTFNTPFAGPPAVTATTAAEPSDILGFFVVTTDVTASRANFKGGIVVDGELGWLTPFHFIAIGPR